MEAGEHELRLSVASLGVTEWSLALQIDPPADGWLHLRAADTSWHTTVVAGAAVVSPLPLTLLEAAAPELACEITLAREPAAPQRDEPA